MRQWRVKYRDERGRVRRRKLIAAIEETAEAIRRKARRVHHRWQLVSVRAGEVIN